MKVEKKNRKKTLMIVIQIYVWFTHVQVHSVIYIYLYEIPRARTENLLPDEMSCRSW